MNNRNMIPLEKTKGLWYSTDSKQKEYDTASKQPENDTA